MRLRSIALPLLALAVVLGTFVVRGRRPPPVALPEGDVAPAPPDLPPSPSIPPAPAASRTDVGPTLERSFDHALVVDPDARPAFVSADLNGDDVPDLAIVVRPRDRDALDVLNRERPAFRLQDANASSGTAASPDTPVASDERLLAIVHGVAGTAWREHVDRPRYLVRHAAGDRLRARALADVPDAVRMRVTRSHVGDVLALQRDGAEGIVFWTGAAYVWAPTPGATSAKGR
jgi:hypothetical protein